MVALVPRDRLAAFLTVVRAQFYADVPEGQLSDLLFVTAPGPGASFVSFDAPPPH